MGTITFTIIFMLVVLVIIGTPIAFALGFTALAAVIAFMSNSNISQFAFIAYSQGISINQLVAPLFVLMAEFLAQGGIAANIFTVLNERMRKFKGGLGISATLACTIFAALCGSSTATAAAIGRISISEMIDKGYRPDFATGIVMAGGTLGIMIPPSMPFVLYGIITETSIAKLLMAGLIPGLMISVMLCVYILIRLRLNPDLANEYRTHANESAETGETASRSVVVISIFLPFVLIFIVLGSMYTGLATPTESAGLGAIGSLLIVAISKRLNSEMLRRTFVATAKTSCMILFLAICGMGLTYIVSYLGLASGISKVIAGSGLNKWAVLALVYLLWLVLGCLMDPGSMVILTIPFLLPALNAIGFDTIWLGVVSTLMVEVGMITPPVGLNLFVTKAISNVPMRDIIKGSLPFLLVFAIALLLLTIFPEIALWLPSKM
jgi:tripartite ATP-independent transporter DctM subunit